MQEAADVMKEALRKIDIKMPSMPVISNVTAKPVSYKVYIYICVCVFNHFLFIKSTQTHKLSWDN